MNEDAFICADSMFMYVLFVFLDDVCVRGSGVERCTDDGD